jgi:hypothetical protein
MDCYYEYELQNSLRLVLSGGFLSIQLEEVPQ